MSLEDIDSLKNASMIIERFGGIRPMAAKVGAPVTTVQGWKKRDVIPGARRDDVLKAANENSIDISDLLTDEPLADHATIQILDAPSNDHDKGDEDIKISVEPIMRAQPKIMSPSFAPRIDTTHEELMAAIAQGQKKAVRTSLWTMFAFAVLLGGAATLVFLPNAQKIQKHDVAIAGLERQVGTMDKEVQAVNDSASFIKDMVPDDIRVKLENLKTQADAIGGDLQRAAKQAQEISKTVMAADAGSLSDRLSVLEAKLADVQGGQAIKDMAARVRNLEVTLAGQAQLSASMDELTKIVDSLDGQLNEIDDRLSQVQKTPGSALGQTMQGVSPSDMKAAALLIAFSQLRESLNRNTPFGDDVVLLQKLVGNSDPQLQAALAKLAPQAEKGGVLTAEGLSEEFKGLAGDIVFSSLKGENVSVTEKAKVRLTQILNVKKNGEIVGGTPTQQAVARAQEQLNKGDVRGAVATLNTLDGSAKEQALPFIEQAQATLLADQIQTMLRQAIVSNVGGAPMGATPGSTLKTVTDRIQSVMPGQGVVKDEASGLTVLPAPKGFKGFSTSPAE